MRRGTDKPSLAGVFGGLAEVFHPAGQQVLEERDRRLTLVDDVGDGAPPFGMVDLDRKTLTLRKPKPSAE